jgi:hypothetical protein
LGISPLGRLSYAGNRAVGALGYEPEAPTGSDDEKLAEASQLSLESNLPGVYSSVIFHF